MLVEVAGAEGEGLGVPVFGTGGNLYLVQLFSEAAGSVVERLDGALDDANIVIFGVVVGEARRIGYAVFGMAVWGRGAC